MTEFVDGSPMSRPDDRMFHALGDRLGRLHTLTAPPDVIRRPGGAIHSFTLGEGSLADEVADAMAWLAEADIPPEHRRLCDELVQRVARLDFGETLPHALLHPDPTPQNFIVRSNGDLVAIDWTGAGFGPRAYGLAFLLLTAVSQRR